VHKMNKTVFLLLIGIASAKGAFGQQQPAAVNSQDLQLRRMGGMVSRKTPGAEVLLIDARPSGGDSFDELLKTMQAFCEVPIVLRRQPVAEIDAAMQLAREALANPKETGVVIVLLDGGEKTPSLSIYPEDRMAFVNAARLVKGVSDEVAAARIERELWRALCFVAGGVNSSEAHCVLRTVLKPEDLDSIDSRMASPVACTQVANSARQFGLGRVQMLPYRLACAEGWAPMPTNEIQRVIWEQVEARRKTAAKTGAKGQDLNMSTQPDQGVSPKTTPKRK